jgi:hypothetical protein
MKTRFSRRTIVLGGVALALGAGTMLGRAQSRRGVLLSAFENARGDQYVGGLSLADGRVFGAQVSVRAHGCAIDPRDPQRVVFFARRPGVQAFELRRDAMQARTAFTTPPGRHLAGHGLFSADGAHLYTPEHDYENARGVLAVRDARTFAVVAELDTHGIDPHEIAWLPDARSLLVANGGILTHPKSFRRKLNVPTMDPSLCVIDAISGACRDQHRLPDRLLSIRHLAPAADGTAVVGLQYEGPREQAPGVVALYRDGRLRMLSAPAQELRRLNGYVSSVAVSVQRGVIAAACPYGAGVACWSLMHERWLGVIDAREAYGVSPLADGELIASRRDGGALALEENRLRSHFLDLFAAESIRWDDHWVAAT